MAATRDEPAIRAFLSRVDSLPSLLLVFILGADPLDSVTIAHQAELLAAAHRRATTTNERSEVAQAQVTALWNRGRPSEASRWLDTLGSLNAPWTGYMSLGGAVWFGGESPPDTSAMDSVQTGLWCLSRGDVAAGDRLVAILRAKAAKDTLRGNSMRIAALVEAWAAVQRGSPTAGRLVDVADSLWRGYEDNSEWASIQLARLYEVQGRADRALRAVRRRRYWLDQPNPGGLAESLRLEGRLAALSEDRAGAVRAYRNYLRMRVDPEPSRIPQRDSVVAELAAVGDLEGSN